MNSDANKIRRKIENPYAKKRTTQQKAPKDSRQKDVQKQSASRSRSSGNGNIASASSTPSLSLSLPIPQHNPNTNTNTSTRSRQPQQMNMSFSQAFEFDDVTTFNNQNQNDPTAKADSIPKEQQQQQQQPKSSSINSNIRAMNSTNSTSMTPAELTSMQPHVLHVSTKQRGNGVLRFIRNVPFAYTKIAPDYILGPNRCALFLSFKYHNLHPNYIHRRIAEIKSDYDLRVLLCLVDVDDNASIILYLNKISAVNNLTLVLAWSEEEVARYLETFKAFEGKDASTIQKKKEATYTEQVADLLGAVRSVNKTDSAQLLSQFGTLKNVITAPIKELQQCPGIGEKKVRRLFDAFHKPFSSAMSKKRKLEAKQKEKEGSSHSPLPLLAADKL
eukprot:CAMPEP_0194103702 /NCGR_PEP_ID=MMETSP0150-20130528/4120_1 /TAXON_ID=122233 /ORGANISM="Chaetoceros debilis, Strain MM31A-1" /LENGTH=387 /DNA_ID=CAMNT_0038791017 /DNA_START=30 /DNA_END=1193 /DNA_ORIENTATION=+